MTTSPTDLDERVSTLLERSETLRRRGRADQAIEPAEQAVELAARLAREDPVRQLLALARATDNLGRCYQHARQFGRAAAAFEQAVSGFAILAHADPHAHGATLVDAMSNHALSLAQLGELERAHAVALATVELAEQQPGWGTLPLIVGVRQFLADLAEDLGRPEEALGHLLAGMRLLRAAIIEQQPGAAEAAARLAASSRALCETHGLALPDEVAAMLD
ncbi:MAG TPA: tetratricopeptide repeat protein [Enhygromyxa sp.]|nr:tetratricopeptide repeat protein [Enhygromyxa sp.]